MEQNVAYTKKYADYWQSIDEVLFLPVNFIDEKRHNFGNIYIITRCYRVMKKDYPIGGSTNDVIVNGEVFYTFRTHNISGSFQKFIHHNGKEYLFFKSNLYGYSMLDLKTGKDYNYFPQNSFPSGETFIWSRLHYNALNNIAAVDGCYWACSSSVVLVDLRNPLCETVYFDIQDHYGEIYRDCQFVRWDGTKLIVKLLKGKEWEETTFKKEQYMSWFKKFSNTEI